MAYTPSPSLGIFRVQSLPATAKSNALYLVQDASDEDILRVYATGADPAKVRRLPVLGVDAQSYSAALSSIAGLTTAAGKGIYTTAADTYATFDLSAFGRSLLDDADAASGRTTLGLGSADTPSFASLSLTSLPTSPSGLAATDLWNNNGFIKTGDASEDVYGVSWTPEIADAATGGNVGSYAGGTSRYSRVGDLVFIEFELINIDTTGMTGTNEIFIRGLPFTAASGTFLGTLVFGLASTPQVIAGSDYIQLKRTSNYYVSRKVGELTSGSSDLFGTVTYRVA